MPPWTFWRGAPSDTAQWGKSPALRVGETVRVEAGGDGELGVYQARVRAIGLRRIFLETDEAALPARMPLTVFYDRGDALYHFETRSVGPARTRALTVAFPRQIVRLQRRQFYRLPLEAPTTFRLLNQSGRIDSEPFPARLVNLSGGGALLSSAKGLPSGMTVSVRVPTGTAGEAIPVEAETLGCRVASQGAARVYLSRLRFCNPPRLSEEDREAIIAYIHEQQRLMLRTRKLLR